MAEITKNQWDEFFHKIDEKIVQLTEKTYEKIDEKIATLAEETHKNLDSKIENKVNTIALKHFGIRYQWLLVILGVFGLILAGVGIQVTLSLSLMKDVQYLVAIHNIQSERPHIRSHNKEFYRKQPMLQSIEPYISPTKSQKAKPTKDTKSRKKASL